MSSNPPLESGRSRRPRPSPPLAAGSRPAAGRRLRLRSRPLETRLIVALVALLALVCVVVGLVTELALEQFLIGRLDSELLAAGGRSAAAQAQPPPFPHGGPGPDFLPTPGQAAGTLGAEVTGGQVRAAAVLTAAGGQQRVSGSAFTALLQLPADGLPHTRSLGDLGDYRLVAARAPDGDVIITGLPLGGVQETLVRLALVMGAVAAAALLATGVAGVLIVRSTLLPLRRMAATARRVAELPLDRGEVALPVRVADRDTDPLTEVGQVGAALNQMLGHIAAALAARQASESRLRQFIADASHELRTPLAAIRGYAELALRGHGAMPPDLVHAVSRVESESVRMTTLVEELLLLARLDSGLPPVREPADLSRVVAEAAADARVAGPGQRWRLELPAEPVLVTGDARQLQQVMANLLSNARVHTPPGTTVAISLSTGDAGEGGDAGEAVIRVADDGPGIPAALLPEVFERFVRGDSSRSRAAGSTGLGLSIVAAVVGAHGGRVAVTSRPGRTEFTVTLPRRPG